MIPGAMLYSYTYRVIQLSLLTEVLLVLKLCQILNSSSVDFSHEVEKKCVLNLCPQMSTTVLWKRALPRTKITIMKTDRNTSQSLCRL